MPLNQSLSALCSQRHEVWRHGDSLEPERNHSLLLITGDHLKTRQACFWLGIWPCREGRENSLLVFSLLERLTPSGEGLATGAALGSVCKRQNHVEYLSKDKTRCTYTNHCQESISNSCMQSHTDQHNLLKHAPLRTFIRHTYQQRKRAFRIELSHLGRTCHWEENLQVPCNLLIVLFLRPSSFEE